MPALAYSREPRRSRTPVNKRHGGRRLLFWGIAGALLCLIYHAAVAEAMVSTCEVPAALRSTRPDSPGTATPVKLGILVIDIRNISDSTQTFETDMRIDVLWKDPRLSAASLGHSLENCRVDMEDIWNPGFRIANQRNIRRHFPDRAQIDADGNVAYGQRISGELTTSFDLRDFPRDEQVLSLQVAALYAPEELAVELIHASARDDLRIPDWTFAALNFKVGEREFLGRNVIWVELSVLAERRFGYYLFRVLLPLILIALMSFSVFTIDPSELGAQVTISTSSVLTLLMFYFSLEGILPKIPYITKMDFYVLGTSLLVFAALAESVTTAALAGSGRTETARRIDRHARWVFPSLLLLLLVTAALI